MTEAEEDALYAEVGRKHLEALIRSTRMCRRTYEAAVELGWTPEQTAHYIETGEQPNPKPTAQA